MARVAANRRADPIPPAFMDRLSHGVIKETSKSLRHYMNVKRRENGFILNPNSSALESAPVRARCLFGTAKHYPPHYGTSYSDYDIKLYSRNFQQQQRRAYPMADSTEKQICREELNFHMGPMRSQSRENQKFADLRLRPAARSASMNATASGRDYRQGSSQSAYKLSTNERRHLVDDTADILGTMLRTRRSMYETNNYLQEAPHNYIQQGAHPHRRVSVASHPERALDSPAATMDSEASTSGRSGDKPKPKPRSVEAESKSIMRKAKPVDKEILCDYKITVVTGDHNGASCDAPIQIRLFGTNGYTKFVKLTESKKHKMPFAKDHTDEFVVQLDHVGRLAGIEIGHYEKDIRSSWFLEKVSILDPIRGTTSEIPCNAWLSTNSDDGKTMRRFPVTARTTSKSSRSHRSKDNADARSDRSTVSMGDPHVPSTDSSSDPGSNVTDKKSEPHGPTFNSSSGPGAVRGPKKPDPDTTGGTKPHKEPTPQDDDPGNGSSPSTSRRPTRPPSPVRPINHIRSPSISSSDSSGGRSKTPPASRRSHTTVSARVRVSVSNNGRYRSPTPPRSPSRRIPSNREDYDDDFFEN